MGNWAKSAFGFSEIGSVGIVIAGTGKPDFEKEIISYFDKVSSKKDRVFHAYVGEKNNVKIPIVFNVYGAPAMIDLLAEMHDGGCKTVIFTGAAYGGFKNLDIGTLVIPDNSYHFEGIYHPIKPDQVVSLPDKELREKIKELFRKKGVNFEEGVNLSVPAVTFQLPHANVEYKKLSPTTLEMELASCFSRGKEIGIRTAGILWISDNKSSSIGDEKIKKLKNETKKKMIRLLIENITQFNMPEIKTHKKFTIDSYLASIIEDPEDSTNIYKNSEFTKNPFPES